jgi:hypothetical protein
MPSDYLIVKIAGPGSTSLKENGQTQYLPLKWLIECRRARLGGRNLAKYGVRVIFEILDFWSVDGLFRITNGLAV